MIDVYAMAHKEFANPRHTFPNHLLTSNLYMHTSQDAIKAINNPSLIGVVAATDVDLAHPVKATVGCWKKQNKNKIKTIHMELFANNWD